MNSWNRDVHGDQILPLINLDADAIRVVAGPGTGKTFGLVRRVERLMHPEGLGTDGGEVLVVAFNRVIAKQLQQDIAARLETFEHEHEPTIRTIHALCVDVIGEDLRLLLPHEREAMIYDTLVMYPFLDDLYGDFRHAAQALRDHEAGHADHLPLWRAAREWLERHRAHLVNDLPGLLLDRLRAGDFPEESYEHVIVDEFQDLTSSEQQLMFRLRRRGGQLVALGDPRQSIYAFRGNDREGLANLEGLAATFGGEIADVPMNECHRCPERIVVAANRLMALAGVDELRAVGTTDANLHVVTWPDPHAEALGMAAAIARNISEHPEDRHLALATRRAFGYWTRDEIATLDPTLRLDLSFSEGLLESWAAREAFLLFCLLADPDPPTWRAWLGYKNSMTGSAYLSPRRNADAYLRLLGNSADSITEQVIQALAREPRGKPRGTGGTIVWDRAQRFSDLRGLLVAELEDAEEFMRRIFDSERWIGTAYEDPDGARLDLQLIGDKALDLLQEQRERHPDDSPAEQLRRTARRLRHQIATREPLTSTAPADLLIATLWGAKGMTAEHVYIIGACGEALPGIRREDYPGTEADYVDEQRRLFYVSITRSKRTLVLSRAARVRRGEAKHLGLSTRQGDRYWADLSMSPFLREIIAVVPDAVAGADWQGCS